MLRAIADDTRNAASGPCPVYFRRRGFVFRCVNLNTGMIVVKDEYLLVFWIGPTADSDIAGTQIAIRNVFRQDIFFDGQGLTAPRPILPVSRDHHPFFTQRMPAFFPRHKYFRPKVW